MPSDELQLIMAGYILGDLSPEEAAALEELLRQDPAIAQEMTNLQAALELSYDPPAVPPPPHLRSALLAKAQPVPPQAPPLAPSLARPRFPFSWRTGLELAAAGLIAALAINNYRLEQALQTRQATQPDAAVTYVLDATKPNSSASATVVVNPTTLEATLSVKNLPPLPPGKVYALWTVLKPNAPFTTDEKAAILTDVFEVDAAGNFAKTIPVPHAYRTQEIVVKVAVTIEDSQAPQKHMGNPIMITGL